jgi:hypothetical protein
MATTALDSTTAPKARAVSPAAGWSPAARAAGAFTFIASGLLWVLADVIGFGKDGVESLAWTAAHPTLAGIGLTADIVAVPFLYGATLVWLLLSLRASRKLAIIGATMLTFGLAAQATLNGIGMAAFLVAVRNKVDLAVFNTALGDGTDVTVPTVAFMAMFFIGAFVGIVIMMVAVWRSRALPRPAAALLVAFQVAGFVPLHFPTTVLAAAGLVWMAIALLRSGRATAGAAPELS